MFGYLKNLKKRYQDDRRGVTSIEFAIIALPFLALVLGIIEFGLAFFVNRTLDHAVEQSARLIRTGQAQNQGFNEARFREAICDNLVLPCDGSRLLIDVRKYKTFRALQNQPDLLDEDGKPKDEKAYDPGKQNELVSVRVIYRWPMFVSFMGIDGGDTGNSERLIYSTAIFRNEPY